MEETYLKAAQIISGSGYGVALSGAGMSAESGIMTYRDRGGLWDRYPEGGKYGILGLIEKHPEDALAIIRDFIGVLKKAMPNAAHRALVELESRGCLGSVITQNVDGLHAMAGSNQVYELHGNIYRLRCLSCGNRIELAKDEFFEMADRVIGTTFLSLDAMFSLIPRCECGGFMRPDIVGFGEPVQDFEAACEEVSICSWMIIVGTSGMVYPAASLPYLARENNAFIIEINTEKSKLSHLADILILGSAGRILPLIMEGIGLDDESIPERLSHSKTRQGISLKPRITKRIEKGGVRHEC
ncbi:MAG: hypothetical protein JXM72_00450 [Deltaproteobacteria bacterium]|nr:hypothetical protein [Deltaproteobacteria bacterium]